MADPRADPRADLRAALSRARRLLNRYRRVVGGLLAAVAVLGVVETVAPASPATRPVVVAAADLQSGDRLAAGDVRVRRLPLDAVPSGAFAAPGSVVGRMLASPARAGEVLTDVRLVGRSLIRGYPPGTVASPVRIGDASAVSLLEVGDAVDVYAVRSDRAPAQLVVPAARVVALPEPVDDQQGRLVVLAVSSAQAAQLAQAGATAPLSFALLR